MNVLSNIEQLLTLSGKRIAFFGGSFNPPHFGHLDFIKKAKHTQQIDHIIICPNNDDNELNVDELKHRMRIMDLIMETNNEIDVFVLSPEECNGIESKIFIDDIFYLLKRRKKEIFVLIGCDSLDRCAKAFKSKDVTFIVGCRIKRSDAEKQLVANNIKCTFIDDIIPCSASELKNDPSKSDSYLSPKIIEYMEENSIYGFDANTKNYN